MKLVVTNYSNSLVFIGFYEKLFGQNFAMKYFIFKNNDVIAHCG